MAERTIYARGSSDDIRAALAAIPQGMRGGGGAARAMLLRCGLALKSHIHAAFLVKARGGTDEAGDRWQPLSPTTIAYRRARRTQTERRRESHPSQALTKRQRERWQELYCRGLAMFNGDAPSAAKRAWAILKREGATTLLAKYGNQQVEILRDTGLLLNSLSPAVASSKYAVLQVGQGEVTVGTNRPWARTHHEGVPGKIPQRRLWPAPDRWPGSWWGAIIDQVRQGIVDITAELISRG